MKSKDNAFVAGYRIGAALLFISMLMYYGLGRLFIGQLERANLSWMEVFQGLQILVLMVGALGWVFIAITFFHQMRRAADREI
jgi:prolipoprotein diacylglyceryltransferase